jgi:hypothetical protein
LPTLAGDPPCRTLHPVHHWGVCPCGLNRWRNHPSPLRKEPQAFTVASDLAGVLLPGGTA